ncbi:MAG: MoaD/ThiS family protein [Bacteroidota bacterium]
MKIQLSGISAEVFNSEYLETERKLNRVSDLKKYLLSKKPELSSSDTRVSINSILAEEGSELKDEDIILVFHPYAGG